MKTTTPTHQTRGELLGKALTLFVSLLLVSLLIIFAIEPSIYTTTLWPGWVRASRYPWPVLLFLGALIAFLSVPMYGVLHHWRWLFWLILIAFTGAVIQIPVEVLQLLGVFPNPYPIWGLPTVGTESWNRKVARKSYASLCINEVYNVNYQICLKIDNNL